MTTEETFAPAPGVLSVVEEFVNTRLMPAHPADPEGVREALDSPVALRDWLAARRLLPPDAELSEGDLRWAVEVREALRGAMSREGSGGEGEALETLNRAARGAQLQLRFSGHNALLVPASPGIDGALGHLLAMVAAAMARKDWQLMRRCANETCSYVFYDRSKNHSAHWCGTRCGNIVKARAYRQRKKAGTGAPGEPAPPA